jgi:4-diphosphocytidyl-2-C-methyl-D-erythritol kinase
LVNPGIHVSTAAAFAGIKPSQPPFAAKEIAQEPLINWKEKLLNDFEGPVFLQYPEIANIKDQLYTAGAIYASMSGTGSTVYGLFEKDRVPAIEWPSHYFTKILAG